MKQLDLFEISPSLPLAREEVGSSKRCLEPTSPGEGVGRFAQGGNKEGLGEIGNPTEPSLDQQRLAHYRNKLAQWEANGYDEVIDGQPMSVLEIIECDTIHEHNELARDMKIIATLKHLRWSDEAIHKYFQTKRKHRNTKRDII